MKVVSLITDSQAVDRIIAHLKLKFIAEKIPPSHVFTEIAMMGVERPAEYF